ncbi:MAG: hypothetical protein IT518_26520 [Burkholderiales bacterium]|nr:hypothetical protein [Burkholderiales bacterium]
MDTFAPGFSKYWLGDGAGKQADAGGRQDAGKQDAKQESALKELADLVSAARSIV